LCHISLFEASRPFDTDVKQAFFSAGEEGNYLFVIELI